MCRGPIHYTGRGRKPATCSPACRRRYRTANESARKRNRRRGITRIDELAARLGNPDDWSVQLDPPTPRSTLQARLGDVPVQLDSDDWRGEAWKRERWRRYDPAAAWIAEHRPDYLDEWLRDMLAVN